ncbi:hypothetical protein [Oceanidesulfovibrio marinus]|uniref:Uncharacterized protein n=1 Tax=Oceanidesulfovibrio marinus TaxID=370038 RepID=A0ABX6NGC2_9BACT|nr:hypothetical protein [Oceanidesulfovibrio marinus]QJT09678.1 hypothetical protein E8L03_12365 [Oceanidesulfovibrio marinus]
MSSSNSGRIKIQMRQVADIRPETFLEGAKPFWDKGYLFMVVELEASGYVEETVGCCMMDFIARCEKDVMLLDYHTLRTVLAASSVDTCIIKVFRPGTPLSEMVACRNEENTAFVEMELTDGEVWELYAEDLRFNRAFMKVWQDADIEREC